MISNVIVLPRRKVSKMFFNPVKVAKVSDALQTVGNVLLSAAATVTVLALIWLAIR